MDPTAETVLVKQTAVAIRDSFIDEGVSTVEINMGSCADFAHALHTDLEAQGIETIITGLDYYWAEDGGVDEEALARRSAATLPPGLTWDVLTEVDLANAASHTWVEHDGLAFDAELVEGVKNPFDFPCIRHALTEIMAMAPGRLEALVEHHAWWREAMNIRQTREQLMPHLRNTFAS